MLTVALVVAFSLMSPVGASIADGCPGATTWTGTCSASSDGSQVDLGASTNTPGTGNQTSPGRGEGYAEADQPTLPTDLEDCLSELCRPTYSVEVLPDVTASDLASFRPMAAAVSGEPAGLGIVGMATNLVADASTHQLSGPLLCYDVRVRFTPVAFRFDHGDGSTRSTTTGGASWSALGVADYSPTPTSHVFRAAGSYRVQVAVVYSAAVDFGNGSWRPVEGAVTSAASGYDVRIVEVRTALVDRTCGENPRGPGC